MGGDNKKRNIAILTPEEHFLAHKLLVKIYPNNQKLVYACQAMTMDIGNRKTRKLYGWLKRKHSQIQSEKLKGKDTWNKGKKMSKDYCDTISKSKSGSNHPLYGKHHSQQTKKKQSDAHNGERSHMFGKFGKLHHNAKKVAQYTKDMQLVQVWDSLSDITRELGIGAGWIVQCCKGQKQTAKSFIWKYVE